MLTDASPRSTRADLLPSVGLVADLLPEPPSDRVLVIRAASGDDRAFAEIVRRYTSLLRATAARILRHSSEVDDVVQDTFVAAWTHMDGVIDGETIVGWLMTTVRRRSYDRLRSADTRRRTEFQQDLLESSDRGPAATAERSSLIEEAKTLLERMPALQRRCWELRQLRQYSYEEIGIELGVTTTSVRGQLARARQMMESKLSHWR